MPSRTTAIADELRQSLLHYLSHGWHYDRSACEVYATVGVGRPPHAGDTVLVEVAPEPLPVKVLAARWQDDQSGGVLVLHVAGDQQDVIDQLFLGVSIRSRDLQQAQLVDGRMSNQRRARRPE